MEYALFALLEIAVVATSIFEIVQTEANRLPVLLIVTSAIAAGLVLSYRGVTAWIWLLAGFCLAVVLTHGALNRLDPGLLPSFDDLSFYAVFLSTVFSGTCIVRRYLEGA